MSGKHRKRRARADKASLPGRASRALGWSLANNITARMGTLPIGIVLARLLGPHSFGTFAVALLAMLTLISFNDLSVSLAIVRWEGDPARIAPTVATLSVASSLAIYGGCFAAAPAFAAAMGAPGAASVIRVLALNVVVDGLVATPAALLQRHFRQDRRMIADQVNTWLGAAVSIGLAWLGFGPMSLAAGWITGAIASAAVFLGYSPVPVRFGFDPAIARALLRYGAPLAGSSLISFAITNADQVVVGHLLGATALGYYALAVNLATWPVVLFSRPTRSVAPAVFARLQHEPAAMRASFLSTAGLLAAATLPACLLMSGAAAPLITLVYGARWAPAAAALTWLGVLSALRIGFELVYDFFVVLARSRALFIIQLTWLASLIPALAAGASAGGISGAALAKAIVAGCVVLPCYAVQLGRVGIGWRQLAARLWPPAVIAVTAGGAAAFTASRVRADLTALAITSLIGLAGLAALAWWAMPALAELRRSLLRESPATGPMPAPAGGRHLAVSGAGGRR